jgi:hypothetical protein
MIKPPLLLVADTTSAFVNRRLRAALQRMPDLAKLQYETI